MPKGVYTCQYNECGKSCMREDGCYRHNEIGQQNKNPKLDVVKNPKKKLIKEWIPINGNIGNWQANFYSWKIIKNIIIIMEYSWS